MLLSNDLILSEQNEISVLHRFQLYHLRHHQQHNHFSLPPGIDSKGPNANDDDNGENDEDEDDENG